MTGLPFDETQLNSAWELMFYGFRALTAPPDSLLAARGWSRVHHRILYFVARTPGQTVGELLQRLGVTKQALNGPLKALQQAGLVSVTVCNDDRRARRLHLSPDGQALEASLTGVQRALLAKVFERAGESAFEGWCKVMDELAASESRQS
ncbi:MarR family winged helix-turn-helix transcriptional regulator [Jeongeupia naejangsanensis]|uniref:MarR family transcriptional regulator n=1 Tax=Jeongeupia naejangsanensis TaxID=613195 RepID=A0ABS2BIW1_9NEIS|nr:MarR family transcriptional regulator [Jeongeupia naejangsanensis]MBM3115532.1 MarR family transcriptional regulator [Jeongeupia naejangsanensis]